MFRGTSQGFAKESEENVIVDWQTLKNRCLYCGKTFEFLAHGFSSSSLLFHLWNSGMSVKWLSAQTCQDLIDIGWTRSGSFFYKVSQFCLKRKECWVDVYELVMLSNLYPSTEY